VARPLVSLRTALAALALLAAGCGAESLAAQDRAIEDRVPESSTTSATPTTTLATPTTAAPTTTTIPDPNRTLTATARSSVEWLVAFDEPDGQIIDLPFSVPNPHQFGGALTLMVTEGSLEDEWVKVQLPVRPNGQEAWIPTADYNIGETTIRAEVTLSETSVKVFDGEELIAESQAAIGTEKSPTPLGTFYVAAKRLNPPEESYLGEWSLVLSAYSETLPSFSGGLPVIAIHGTNHPDAELGQAISNGCVRVPNEVLQFLATHVPLGSPVIVSA
jgi:lipoprotein-anchoring transpeptidase ErfK/SrfK